MNVQIRVLTENDIPSVLPLLQEMYVEHDLAEPDLFNPHSFSPEQIKAYLQRTLKDENSKSFVAVVNEAVVGTIRVELKASPSFYKATTVAYLDDLVVKDEYRRQGIGRALIQQTLSFAQERGVSLYEAKIYEFNGTTQKLAHALGFKKTFSYFYKRLE